MKEYNLIPLFENNAQNQVKNNDIIIIIITNNNSDFFN